MNIPLYKSREDIASNRFYAFINGAQPDDGFIPVVRIVHITPVKFDTDDFHFETRPAFGRKTKWKLTSQEVYDEVMETGKRLPSTTDPEAVTDYHSLIALGMDNRIIVIDGQKQPAT